MFADALGPRDRCRAMAPTLAFDAFGGAMWGRRFYRRGEAGSRSCRWTEVIGQPLDDQRRIEAWNSYACVGRDEAGSLLQLFCDKVDTG